MTSTEQRDHDGTADRPVRRRHGAARALAVATGLVLLCTACTDDEQPSATTVAAAAATADSTAVSPRCSTATLDGRYLYEIHGDRRFKAGAYPYLEVGEELFDGQGHVSDVHTDSLSRKDASTTGTYTLDATCHGVVTYRSGTVHRLLVSPAGDDYTTYDADGPAPQAGLDGGAERVSTDRDAPCSASSLSGTYSYRSRGFYGGALHVEQGFETFDGVKGVENSYVEAGSADTHHLTGSYASDASCRAHVTYEGGLTFTQYLAPDGSQFLWMQVAGFAAGDDYALFGGREHRVTTSTDTTLTRAGA